MMMSHSTHSRLERNLGWVALAAAIATIPVTILEEHDQSNPLVQIGVWAVWSVFLVEFAVLFALAPNRAAYVRRNVLNLAIVVLSFPLLPASVAFVRLIRLVRIFAVLWWGINEIERTLGRREVLHVAAAAATIVLLSGELLVLLEPETVPNGFWQGVWWAVVTATTVGYGDVVPQTPAGRVLGAVLMLTGLGVVSTLAAAVAAYFIGHTEEADLGVLVARLDRIEGQLTRLTAMLEHQSQIRDGRGPGPGPGPAVPPLPTQPSAGGD
jgi:voltage-gated potassium channel